MSRSLLWGAAVFLIGVAVAAGGAAANGQASSSTLMAEMPTARSGLGLAAVNGKLYAIGGSQNGVDLATVEEYDPATNTWRARAPMPRARRGFAAAAGGNGKIYVVGGVVGDGAAGPLMEGDEYDPATDTWRIGAVAGGGVADHGIVTTDDGDLFVVGGWIAQYGPSAPWDTVGEYDPDAGTWRDLTILPYARTHVGVAAPGNGRMYVVGGRGYPVQNGGGDVYGGDAVYIFNPDEPGVDGRGRWSFGAGYAVISPAVASVDGIVYALAGDRVAAYDPATDTWWSQPPLAVARTRMAAAALGGYVYAVGGNDGSGAATGVVERYDPIPFQQPMTPIPTRTPTPTATPRFVAEMPTARHALGLAPAGGKLYAIGGSQGDLVLDTVEEYDPAADAWRARAPMPRVRRGFAAATAANGKIYLAGGFVDGSTSSFGLVADVDEYDPATNTWRPRAPLPVPRAYLALVAAPNGKLYAMGGTGGTAGIPPIVDWVDEYDPATDTWTARTPMPKAKQHPAAVTADDGRIYVVGGLGYDSYYPMQVYDPVADRWTTVDGGGSPHPAAAWVGGIVYWTEGGVVYAYDPAAVAWYNDLPRLSVARRELAAAVLDGQIYMVGGRSFPGTGAPSAPLGTVERYAPIAPAARTPTATATTLAGTPSPTRTPTVTPTPVPEYGVSINRGALFTNSTLVTLSISARPGTTLMQVSNDGGFAGAVWERLASTRDWEITSLGSQQLPRIVYVRFQDPRTSDLVVTVTDDIVLDLSPPTGSVALRQGAVLELRATDEVSGVAAMQVGESPDFCGVSWEPYATSKPWRSTAGAVYARFRDNGGNVSPTYQTGSVARAALERHPAATHRQLMPVTGRLGCLG